MKQGPHLKINFLVFCYTSIKVDFQTSIILAERLIGRASGNRNHLICAFRKVGTRYKRVMASAAVAEVSLPPTALRNYISQRHLNNVLVPPYNGTSLSSSLAFAHFF